MFINYMKLNFKGKTAVVTGASGGMGLATVGRLFFSSLMWSA